MLISQELYIFLMCSSILSLTISIITSIVAITFAIKVVGMEKSTHSIQYVDPEIDKENKEFMENWATTDDSITKQNKLHAEDLEDDMEIFSENEDDKKRYSF